MDNKYLLLAAPRGANRLMPACLLTAGYPASPDRVDHTDGSAHLLLTQAGGPKLTSNEDQFAGTLRCLASRLIAIAISTTLKAG